MGAVVVAPLNVPRPPEEIPWLGKPNGVPIVLLAAIVATAPFISPSRKFTAAEEIPGFKSIPFYIPVTPQAVLPFQNVRRTEHVPEPGWVGGPRPPGLSITLLPPINLPFYNKPWKGPIPDPDWVDGGGSVPRALLDFPAQPSFTVKGTRKFDHVPEPYWLGRPTPVSIIYTVPPTVVLPFKNIRRFDHVPEPFWTGEPVAVPLAILIPPQAVQPFQNRRIFNVPDDVPWTMRGKVSAVIGYLTVAPVTPDGSKYTIVGAASDVTLDGSGSDVTITITI